MSKNLKRTGALFAALCLIVSLLSGFALAADDGTVTVDFTTASISYNSADPSTIAGTYFTTVESETTTVSGKGRARNFSGNPALIYVDTKKTPWLSVTDAKEAQWTLEIQMGSDATAGWYDLSLKGGKWYCGGSWYIYADGQYAGLYDCCGGDENATLPTLDTGIQKLNTLYLKPIGENGTVKIVFALAKIGKNATYTADYSYGRLLLNSLTLTPADAPVIDAVELVDCEMPTQMNKGETAGITVKALMDDTTYRQFGYTNSRILPTESNIIKVESTNENIISVTDLEQINPETYATTFTLNAVNSGTAKINVTAIIDGANGEEITKNETYTITVPYTDGSEEAQKDVSYIVRGSTSDFNTGINMTGYTAGTVGSHPLNTSFTATANEEITVENIKYKFAYWQTAGGTPIDESASYTFTPKSNFTLEAVYVPANPEDPDKKVLFWNFNRAFITEITATGETLGEQMPTAPTLNGWEFTNWKTDANTVFDANTTLVNAITRVVAQYTKVNDAFTIDGNTYEYDEMFTKTAETAPADKVFSHWTINGQVASYEETLSFNVWNDVDVEAAYADAAPEKVPTVVLDNIGDEYFIVYEAPEGYSAIDAGIVFSENGAPSVESADSKASVRDIKDKGQFTAVPGDASHATVRGYIMYRVDETGEIRVIYNK